MTANPFIFQDEISGPTGMGDFDDAPAPPKHLEPGEETDAITGLPAAVRERLYKAAVKHGIAENDPAWLLIDALARVDVATISSMQAAKTAAQACETVGQQLQIFDAACQEIDRAIETQVYQAVEASAKAAAQEIEAQLEPIVKRAENLGPLLKVQVHRASENIKSISQAAVAETRTELDRAVAREARKTRAAITVMAVATFLIFVSQIITWLK